MFHAGAAASILRAARQAKVKAKVKSSPKNRSSIGSARRASSVVGRKKTTPSRRPQKKLEKQASSLSMLARDGGNDTPTKAKGPQTFTPEEAETLYQLALDLQEAKRMLNVHSETNKQRLITMEKIDQRVDKFKASHGKHQLIWRIDNVRQRLTEAETGIRRIIYSPHFWSHPRGYRLLCSICPNGEGKAQGQFVSLFFCIMKGEYDGLLAWPFKIPITFSVLDQSGDKEKCNVTRTFVPNPVKENELFLGRPAQQRNLSIGFPKFLPLSKLTDGKYIVDDRIFIKVLIDDKTIEDMTNQ